MENTNTDPSTIPQENRPGKWVEQVKPLRLFLLAIIVLTMYNNLEHSASVYYSIAANPHYTEGYNIFQSYMVVIVIDLSVIAFIISSKKRESEVFAWVLFLVNCLFFNVIQSFSAIYERAFLTNIPTQPLIEEINRVIAKVIFSGAFSYCIHRFSFLWFEKQQNSTLQELIKKQENTIMELTATHKENNGITEDLKSQVERLRQQIASKQADIQILNGNNETLTEENEQLKAKLTRSRTSPKSNAAINPNNNAFHPTY